MIPILFNKDEKTFTSLGLGQMDATLVEVERERNGNYTLYAEVPFNSPQAKHLTKEMLIKADAGARTKWQTFKINRTIKDTNAGVIKVYADHISMDTINDAMKPKVSIRQQTAEGALRQWANNLVSGKTYDVQSDITYIGSTDWTIDEVENARQALGGVSGSILDVWGGEYEFDNNTIILHKEMGRTAPTVLEYGRNIVSLEYEELIDGVYTSIYPYATYTPKSEDNTQLPDIMVTLDELIIDSEYAGNYETRRIQIVDFSGEFDSNAENPEIPTQDKLRTLAKAYVKNNGYGIPKISQEIDFVDLSKTLDYQDIQVMEEIELNDRVPVYYPNIDAETNDVKVTTTNWDVLNNRYSKITLSTIGAMKSNSITSKLNTAIKDLKAEQKKINNTVPYLINGQGNRVWWTTPNDNMEHKIDDTWFKKNGKYTIIYKWNGSMWEEVLNDETFITEIETEVAKAQEEAEKAVQSAKDADTKAQSALTKAGANANLLDTHQNTLNTINNTTIPNINSSISNAMSEARRALSSAGSAMDEAKKVDGKVETFKTDIGETISDVNSKAQKAIDDVGLVDGKVETFKTDVSKTISTISDSAKLAMDEAKKADGKIADYVTRNGLVSGTTVDSKINTATGEWSQNLSRVESKVDNVKAGSRNLILNSNKEVSNAEYILSLYTLSDTSLINPNEEYTITVIGELTDGQDGWYVNAQKSIDGVLSYPQMVTLKEEDRVGENTWSKVFNMPLGIDTNLTGSIRLYSNPLGNRKLAKVSKIKLSKGNIISTDWTPAPEDNYTQQDFEIFEASYNSSVEGINAKLGTVTNKVEDNSTAFTTFKENEYKRTAERVSDTFTKQETTTMLGGKADASQLSNYLAKSTYERDAEQSKERFETIESDLDNISVGGRNLLQNTSDEWKTLSMGAGVWFTNFSYDENYKVEVGQTYTFSIIVDKVNPDDTVPINLHLGLSSVRGSYTYDIVKWRQNNIPMGKKVSITYTITENDVDNGARPWFAYRLRNEQKATHIKYKEAKLEKGTIATDWSPAVEDMANLSYVSSEITKSAEAITTNLANYAKTTDLNGLATETYATNQAVSEAGKVKNELTKYAKTTDLTGLASETYATNVAVSEAGKVSSELTKYAKTTALTGLATQTYAQTQATTEAGKVEQKLTGYAKTTDLNGLATETYATNKAVAEAGKVSSELTKYELKTGVDSKISTASSALRTETAEKMKTVYTKSETETLLGKKADNSTLNNYVQTATYESGIDGVSQSLTRVEGKVDGLQVGGRNLLLNSSDLVIEKQPVNSGNYNYAILKLDLKKDTQYTLSFELEKLGLDYSRVSIYTQYGHVTTQTINLTNSPRQHITFTAVADTNSNITYIYAGVAGSTDGRGIRLSKIKLEKGSIPTDWTPAPEDTLTQDEYKTFKSNYESTVQGITGQITSLSTSKLDGNTYTNFLSNDYKTTAERATSAFTKVNKVIDANGNSIDAFAKAVYDQNATRQSADFNLVTKDLVKTTTYTSGINGINNSISSIRGDLDNLSVGGRNLIVQSNITRGKYFTATGGETADAQWFYTDFIPVSNYKNLVTSGYSNLGNAPSVTYYNSSKVFVKGINNAGVAKAKNITIDSGIAFIRFSGMIKDLPTIKLEQGTIPSDWTPAPEDMLGQADFQVFKNTYESNDQTIKNRLTAIDSGTDGSILYNTNLALETAQGNSRLITTINDNYVTQENINESILSDKKIKDTRNDNQLPNWYQANYPRQEVKEFKTNSVIGIDEAGFSLVTTEVPWTSSSGGTIKQTARTNNDMYIRRGHADQTQWTAWEKVADTTYVNTKITEEAGLIRTELSDYAKKVDLNGYATTQKVNTLEQSVNGNISTISSIKTNPASEIAGYSDLAKKSEIPTDYVKTTNFNQTVETALGNSQTIASLATKTDINGIVKTTDSEYQRINTTSKLYERVIGSTDAEINTKVARMVMTDSVFQTEIATAKNNGLNLIDRTTESQGYMSGVTGNGVLTGDLAERSRYVRITGIVGGQVYTLAKQSDMASDADQFRLSWRGSDGYTVIISLSVPGDVSTVTAPINAKELVISYPRDSEVKMEIGSTFTGFALTPSLTSKITQTANSWAMELKDGNDLKTAINASTDGLRFAGHLIYLDGDTYMHNAFAEKVKALEITADKITAGTLDASKVTVSNIDANKITANKTSFVQSVWNSLESSISINATGLLSKASDNSQVYLQNGVVGARNPSGATIGQIGYAYETSSPWYSMQISHGSHFQIRMSRGSGQLNKQAFYIMSGGTESYLNTDDIYLNPVNWATVQGRFRTQGETRIDAQLFVAERLNFSKYGGYIQSQSNSNMLINASNNLVVYAKGSNALEIDGTHAVFRRQISENSDARLKTNIIDMPIDSLEAIRNLEIKKFDYLDGRLNQYGIIAQQAQNYLPELIDVDSEGYLMVNKSAMTYINMHAIQQLDSRVDGVDDEVAQLKAQIASLQEELATLKGD